MTTTHPHELPQFLRDMISSPPRHGEGVHGWLYRVARQLHAHRSPDEIEALLAAAVDGCGRVVPKSEIQKQVKNAEATAWRPHGGTEAPPRPRPKWPEVDPDKIAELEMQDPFALLRLRHESPVQVSPELHDSKCLLERLFPGDPLLCVAKGHPRTARTLRRLEIKDAGQFSHIVPSPMSKTEGTNQQGKRSPRTLDNTGPREYLVTEFDQGDHGRQAAIIRHLAAMAPLVMVVDSAGKSFHAWWYCQGTDEKLVRKFFSYAIKLGADPATWTRCQLVRLPLGWRAEKGRVQEVVFFDHTNTATRKGGTHE